MDRQITYVGATPLDTDILRSQRNSMVALGALIAATLGSQTVIDGLAVGPQTPAALGVSVAAGSIYMAEPLDSVAYGSLGSDVTHTIMKQGVNLDAVLLNTPAPGTAGQSINYLIQATLQETDTDTTVLNYYNAANPQVPLQGPGGLGATQATRRACTVQISAKAAAAAATGTQATPAPDAGCVGLAVVTVANGQATVVAGNISTYSGAPYSFPKLPALMSAVQSGAYDYAVDSSGAANTLTVSLSPAPTTYGTGGFAIAVKVANANTGATVINVNGLGNKSVVHRDGTALVAGDLKAGAIVTLWYDGTNFQLVASGVTSPMPAVQQGRLAYVSGTQIALQQATGNLMTMPSGQPVVIPSGGITSANGITAYINGATGVALANSTLYYVYLAQIGGAWVLDFSTTAYTRDGTSGLPVKGGPDTTRLYLGMVRTNSSGQFVLSATQIFVVSYWNRRAINGFIASGTSYTTTSTGFTNTSTAIRIEFLCHSDDPPQLRSQGTLNSADTSGNSDVVYVTLALDGSAVGGQVQGNRLSNNNFWPSYPFAVDYDPPTITDGYHFLDLFYKVAGTSPQGTVVVPANSIRVNG